MHDGRWPPSDQVERLRAWIETEGMTVNPGDGVYHCAEPFDVQVFRYSDRPGGGPPWHRLIIDVRAFRDPGIDVLIAILERDWLPEALAANGAELTRLVDHFGRVKPFNSPLSGC